MSAAHTPPDPTATFDSLWDFDEPDAEPSPAGRAAEPRPGKVPPTQRDTLLPPVPPPDYVQTMMELGELDDPSGEAMARLPPPPPVPGAGREGGGLPFGGVLAKEEELLLHLGEGSAPVTGAGALPVAGPAGQVRIGLGAPSMTGRIAGMNRVSGAMAAPARGAPVIAGAPAPRAPSIAPQPPSTRDVLQDLDLMPFEDLAPPRAEPRGIAALNPHPTPPAVNRTPRPTSTPPRNSRTPPTSAGLRLGKTPPPMPAVEEHGDRVTPIASEPPPDSIDNKVRLMQSRFESRNYPGALSLAESILNGSPGHAVARRCAEGCREMMAEKYLSRIGGRNCVPRVAMPPEEMTLLALDHRAGFLLSFIDGAMSVDEVLDVSSMPELDALRIMFELQEQGAIVIEAPARRPARK
jgi:hypothetical protein